MRILIINQFATCESRADIIRIFSFAKESIRMEYELVILESGFSHLWLDAADASSGWKEEEVQGIRIAFGTQGRNRQPCGGGRTSERTAYLPKEY